MSDPEAESKNEPPLPQKEKSSHWLKWVGGCALGFSIAWCAFAYLSWLFLGWLFELFFMWFAKNWRS